MPISKQELSWFVPHSGIFVECGSAGGQGIQAAIEAGFSQIYSVDINPHCFKECSERFKKQPQVHLTNGDCGTWLENTLNNINEQSVIFLDANGWSAETESPYHASIAALRRHGRRDHFVIVDDMNHDNSSRAEMVRDLRRSIAEESPQDIVNQLISVNPDYYLYIEDSHSVDFAYTYPSWILIGSPVDLGLYRV